MDISNFFEVFLQIWFINTNFIHNKLLQCPRNNYISAAPKIIFIHNVDIFFIPKLVDSAHILQEFGLFFQMGLEKIHILIYF